MKALLTLALLPSLTLPLPSFANHDEDQRGAVARTAHHPGPHSRKTHGNRTRMGAIKAATFRQQWVQSQPP